MTSKNTFTITPCVLVKDRITVDRGVKYQRRDLESTAHEDGSEEALWETKRLYKNRSETKEADRVYAKARQRLRSVCLPTPIGFICPLSKKSELLAAIEDAEGLIKEFNDRATACHIDMLVVCTDLSPDNVNGVTLLEDCFRESVDNIVSFLKSFDPKKARECVYSSNRMVDILGEPEAREELRHVRSEVSQICKEMTRLLKEFDNDVAAAQASERGLRLMQRVEGAWKFD